MPPAPSPAPAPAPASTGAPASAVKRFGVLAAPWFPPERSIRCGCIGSRVFLDLREVLEIVTTSTGARKTLYVAWFANTNFESTCARFGTDKTHLRHVQWGGEGEKRLAGSLFLLLPVLRTVNDDLSRKLADEIESRVGVGLDLAIHGGASNGAPATTTPPTTAPDHGNLAGQVAEMKQTLTSISERIERFETHVFSNDAGVTVTGSNAPGHLKRPRENDDEQDKCMRAKDEAEMARANFERDHPDQAYASKFRVIREQIVLAASDGDTQLRKTLLAKLSELVTSI